MLQIGTAFFTQKLKCRVLYPFTCLKMYNSLCISHNALRSINKATQKTVRVSYGIRIGTRWNSIHPYVCVTLQIEKTDTYWCCTTDHSNRYWSSSSPKKMLVSWSRVFFKAVWDIKKNQILTSLLLISFWMVIWILALLYLVNKSKLSWVCFGHYSALFWHQISNNNSEHWK